MDSLADAAHFINGTTSEDGITRLLAALGFDSRPLCLDATSRERLGLSLEVSAARVAAEKGALRALSVEIADGSRLQDCIPAIARVLSARAPHLLWLIVATEQRGGQLAIATWRGHGATMRVAAMITERENVVDSDAETLCALASARATPDGVMRHLRWLDILGRDAVTRRFFVALSRAVQTLTDSLPARVAQADAREIAILTTSRLLFLSFLETKGWLNADFGFLANGFAECMTAGGAYQRSVLEPLFFGTLNTRVSERAPRSRKFGRVPFLNGGLFSRTTVERIHRHARFTDDALGALFGDVLVRYRFTAREDTAQWSQTAIDPEMLGKVFESLMESSDRKRGGVFYTPQHFVARLTHLTLAATLERRGLSHECAELLVGDDADIAADPRILAQIRALRILDPACGSGAFLVYALEHLAHLRRRLGENAPPADIRRAVLTTSIFGVDSSPIAVWLCELRLWLSAVIHSDAPDPMRLTPLPNLDRQIRVGDSLSGDAFSSDSGAWGTSQCVSALRGRYTKATGRRKLSLARQLDTLERDRALAAIESAIGTATFERVEIVRAARSRDLFDGRNPPTAARRERLRYLRSHLRALRRRRTAIQRGATPAFAYPTHFADVAISGGFDAIIGNPPWIRVHNIPSEDRARYRDSFIVYRAGAWSDGARGAQAGRGFASQVDVAALFVERSIDLLAPTGTIGLLLPSKLWRSLAGGGTRQLILDRASIVSLEDHSDALDSFDAAAYPSMLVATRGASAHGSVDRTIRIAATKGTARSAWTTSTRSLPLDASPGSPWLLIPPECRSAFDVLMRAGVPLCDSILQRPHLGVKTGCNSAFVINECSIKDEIATVNAAGQHGEIEASMLRPLVRGETLTPWRLQQTDERLVWTHDNSGHPLRELPAHAFCWLSRFRRRLELRTDSHSERWWALFRIESADSEYPRVIWSDFGRAPRAAVLDAGDPTVPLNTCYAVTCPDAADALAFAAILNSDIVACWLAAIAEPARGGFHRYLGWTIARLPIPIDWPRARDMLAPLAHAARAGNAPARPELRAAVLEAYGVSPASVAPLLAWGNVTERE
ncbi:MAG: N-6 DNA methylase [Gemmatimonadaceae bacterium]